MALFDKNTWYILKHLHQGIAAQAAARIEAGERLQPMAYLVSPAAAHDGQARMHVAEVASEFMAELLSQHDSERLLAKYLADALQEGSVVQRQIDREHGLRADYTICVQETRLPNADSKAIARPAMMVLIHGRNFALPIFHLIREADKGQRICQLRPFPEMQEIEGVQHMLQSRMWGNACGNTLQ